MSLNPFSQSLTSTSPRRRPNRGGPPVARLSLEPLEDRRTPSFSPAVDYPTGSSPQALVTGDFNGDARLDLAVANYNGSTVSVLPGNADGTFQDAVTSATGAGPLSLAVGDFNADGKLDLATANSGDVSVLLGNGNGTFQAPTSTNIGSSPSSAAVGDFNSDGKLDLGVTSNIFYPGYSGWYGYYPGYHVGRANVLLGTGDGSFSAPSTTSLGYGYHTSATVADFNGDLKQDLATASAESNSLSVLLGTGTGTLGLPNSFTAANARSMATADLNADGHRDLVTANGNGVGVLLGTGSGSFGTVRYHVPGSATSSVTVADFNSDGKVDLVTTSALSGSVGVLLGTGTGSFRPPVDAVAGAGATGVAAGDFNGDGRPDVASANSGSHNVSALVNDGNWPALDAPFISIGDVTITEGNAGTVAAFTVSIASAYDQTVSVHYATADGSATLAGGDYQAASGTVNFAPGMTSQIVTVLVSGDRLGETDESFSVRLTDPTNAFVTDSTGMCAIRDDEPLISIAGSVSGTEGNAGPTPFTFTVTLSAPYDAPVTVDYATADLTIDEESWYGPGARAGDDYTAASGIATIAAGEMSQTITVLVSGDRLGEYQEHFFVNLSNPAGARLANTQSRGGIVDDEPFASINSASVVEGNAGTRALTFTVTLTAASDAPVTVSYATVDGTATAAGGDYQAVAGTVTFAPGETSKNVTALVRGDRLGEYDETFSVNLTEAGGALIGNAWGYGSILDNEPRISINSVSRREGHRGTNVMIFRVRLSAVYDRPVTVKFATQNDTARTGDNDYAATSGKLTFAPGQKTKTITVTIKGDKKWEEYECFYVLLSGASSNALIEDPYGRGDILNDDRRRR